MLLTINDVLKLISLVIVIPVIVAIFEMIVIGVIDFVDYWVKLVKKQKVVNPDSFKGTNTLYDRYIRRLRKDVFNNNEYRK